MAVFQSRLVVQLTHGKLVHADDNVQRRTQLVRHARQKTAFRLAGRLRLGEEGVLDLPLIAIQQAFVFRNIDVYAVETGTGRGRGRGTVVDRREERQHLPVAPLDAQFDKLDLARLLRPLQGGGSRRHIFGQNIARRVVQLVLELLFRVADKLKKGFVMPEDRHEPVIGALAYAAGYAGQHRFELVFKGQHLFLDVGYIERKFDARFASFPLDKSIIDGKMAF